MTTTGYENKLSRDQLLEELRIIRRYWRGFFESTVKEISLLRINNESLRGQLAESKENVAILKRDIQKLRVMEKHFVEFLSPGTIFAERSAYEIGSWNPAEAMRLADDVTERHGATPYGFQFITRSRSDGELDSKVVKRSPTYYLGGGVQTLAELEARNDPAEEILRGNMRCNGYARIIVNTNSYRWTAPLEDGDVVLDYTPPSKRGSPSEGGNG